MLQCFKILNMTKSYIKKLRWGLSRGRSGARVRVKVWMVERAVHTFETMYLHANRPKGHITRTLKTSTFQNRQKKASPQRHVNCCKMEELGVVRAFLHG